MLQLFALMLAVGPPTIAPGAGILDMRDRTQAVGPVSDKWILPPKIYDCKTEAEDRAALDQRLHGETPQCWPKELEQKYHR